MTNFPRSPRLLKGAIIGLDPFNPLASVIIFQYNPESLTRNLTPQIQNPGGNASKGKMVHPESPPRETIQLRIEIDAADQLEQAEATATTLGVYPALSSLEMLLYPKSALVIANEVLLRLGVRKVIEPEAPLTLFIWGPKRVVPVRITSYSINEQAFDPALNPIQASVSLSMTVLNYQDLGLLSPGGAVFMAHQIIKEVMATISGVGNISSSASFSASVSLGG